MASLGTLLARVGAMRGMWRGTVICRRASLSAARAPPKAAWLWTAAAARVSRVTPPPSAARAVREPPLPRAPPPLPPQKLPPSSPATSPEAPVPASASTFGTLGLSDELLAAVTSLGLAKPTEIQAAAIPRVLAGGDLVLASHTGSGKTLAYLLPLVQALRRDEAAGVVTRPRHPRALVLGPARELTQQVLGVAKALCHHARFRSAGVSGGTPLTLQVFR